MVSPKAYESRIGSFLKITQKTRLGATLPVSSQTINLGDDENAVAFQLGNFAPANFVVDEVLCRSAEGGSSNRSSSRIRNGNAKCAS